MHFFHSYLFINNALIDNQNYYTTAIFQEGTWKMPIKNPLQIQMQTVIQFFISDFEQEYLTDPISASEHLPPIKIPLKTKISHKISKSLYQQSQDCSTQKKPIRFSIRKKKYNDQYLQQFIREQNRKNAALSLQRPILLDPKKKDIFMSAKIDKINKVKAVEIRPALRSLKEEYKIREESVQRFLTESNELQNYKMLSHLGKGCFSVVSLAVNKQTNKRFAIKTYAKIDQIQDYKFDNIYREINHLRLLSHGNIVNLFHVIKDKRKLLLIMEDGGKLSLAGLLRKNKTIPEKLAQHIFKQIAEAINYCHQNKICHRDLKLQNILVDQNNVVKVIDFGFSSKSGQKLSNHCGTPPYMAPQITLKTPYYGEPADMWALGILLYLMLYGKFPFRAPSERQLFRLIQQGKFQTGQGISAQAKETISKLLRCSTRDRTTAGQLLASPWLR